MGDRIIKVSYFGAAYTCVTCLGTWINPCLGIDWSSFSF